MQLIKTNKRVFFTSVAVFALVTTSLIASADARPHHRKSRHYVAATAGNPGIDDRYAHVAQGGFGMMMQPQSVMRQQPTTRQSRRAVRQAVVRQGMTRQGLAMNTMSLGSSGLVAQARAYVGSNPTGRSRLWCARFLNMVLERSGRRGTGSDMASSFASFGNRVSGPQVGAIAVMSRGKRGGHVGIVSGIDESGNPIVISGNHNGRVAEATYPRGRIYSYVMP
jgi:uncharacterized protein (TIGR02594 family)